MAPACRSRTCSASRVTAERRTRLRGACALASGRERDDKNGADTTCLDPPATTATEAVEASHQGSPFRSRDRPHNGVVRGSGLHDRLDVPDVANGSNSTPYPRSVECWATACRVDRAGCPAGRDRSERLIPVGWRRSRLALRLPPHVLVRHVASGSRRPVVYALARMARPRWTLDL